MRSLPLSVTEFPPRAPSQAEWDALSEDERVRVIEALPAWMSEAELAPPEGDPHYLACATARDTLEEYYSRVGRSVYVASDLAVYYPQERRFAPDLLLVFDVTPGPREKWLVLAEGKGLDFVMEVLHHGDRAKDLGENVKRYARLGIPEYFVYDLGQQRLHGYHLAGGSYNRVVPQHGRYASRVLGLDLTIEENRLVFHHGSATLLSPRGLLAQVQRAVDQMTTRLEAAEAARLAEAARAEAEAEARVQAEAAAQAQAEQLAAALAEIERLKRAAEKK
jgi:Uma2 family endonuclease